MSPSARSLAVLVTVLERGSVAEAAHSLGLTVDGIRWHVRACQAAFGGVTREQAVVIAIQRGLIDVRAVRIAKAA